MPTEHRIDAARFDVEARRAAAWIASQGLVRGDRVAVRVRNDPTSLALMHGALRMGVLPVVVRDDLPPDVVAQAEPALSVDHPAAVDWSELRPADVPGLPLGRPVFFTSGTTGRPRAVVGEVLDEHLAREWADDEAGLWNPVPDGTWLVCSPLHHSAGFRSATSALLAGSSVILLERFDADSVVRSLAEEPVTGTFLVPTHFRRILRGREDVPAPSSARRILHAGEPCPEGLKRRVLEWAPPGAVWEFYGSTEGQFTAISPEEWLERPGSVGKARAGRRLEILDPGPDGVGAVYVSAPSFAGWEYAGDPAATAAAWRGDRFTSGDVGRLDDGAYLYLESRREDLIITGGVNVYPAEVERALAAHPGGGEVVVFGVPDPEWGQRVCAAFTLPPSARAEVEAWVRENLSGPRRPKTLFFVEDLPRTPTGKLDRRAVRDALT